MFSDITCPICNIQFKDNDDIVVCPICGTPHHRKCFDKTKSCFNKSFHEKGRTFSNEIKEKKIEQERIENEEFTDRLNTFKKDAGGIFCANCSALNSPDGLFCVVCGRKLLSEDKYIKKIDYDSLDTSIVLKTKKHEISYYDKINGIPSKEYAAFVGINIDYFLPLFERFKNKKISFNFSALLLPSIYFFYRKMWILGTVINILMLLFYTSNCLFYVFTTKMPPNPFVLNTIFVISVILGGILLSLVVCFSLFVNYRYYKKANKVIKNLKSQMSNKNQYYKKLQKNGFVNIKSAALSSFALAFLLICGTIIVSS